MVTGGFGGFLVAISTFKCHLFPLYKNSFILFGGFNVVISSILYQCILELCCMIF